MSSDRTIAPPRRPAGLPSWSEAAEDWLAAKQVGRRVDDPGHSDRARRTDLRRWATAINTVHGRTPAASVPAGSMSGWDSVTTELGDSETLLRALDLLGEQLAASSRQRMLSTLRGFCGYLVRRGLLTSDPTAADELTVNTNADAEVRAFTIDDVDALLTAAATPPPRQRSAWPARDVAIIDVFAHCGLRVSELCALAISDIDRRGEDPLLRLRYGTKGGRRRVVPIPRPTLARLDAYLTERAAVRQVGRSKRVIVFVRHDGAALNQQFLDATLRRAAATCGVRSPDGALAHGLRHTYAADLANRGVHLSVIQQILGHVDPRTTSIYTRAHAGDLAHALREAGAL